LFREPSSHGFPLRGAGFAWRDTNAPACRTTRLRSARAPAKAGQAFS